MPGFPIAASSAVGKIAAAIGPDTDSQTPVEIARPNRPAFPALSHFKETSVWGHLKPHAPRPYSLGSKRETPAILLDSQATA